jgi:hypothetical protein
METMALFKRRLNRWERRYGCAAAERLRNKLFGLRMSHRYAKGSCGDVIKQVLFAGAAREKISVALFVERCFENQRTGDIIRYIDPDFAEKRAATNRIKAAELAEMAKMLDGFLEKKRMGMPLSVEEQARSHLIAHLLPHDGGEPCRMCVSERRTCPAERISSSLYCLEHLEEEIDVPVVMTA